MVTYSSVWIFMNNYPLKNDIYLENIFTPNLATLLYLIELHNLFYIL